MAQWNRFRLAELIELDLDRVAVDVDGEYAMAGVFGFGRGLLLRTASVRGADISAKHLFRLRPKQIIYSRLKAFEGAFALVPDLADQRHVTNEFPTFTVRPLALPEYLIRLLQLPMVYGDIAAQSIGVGARRERLKVEDFLAYEIEVPDVDIQGDIVAALEVFDRHQQSLEVEARTTFELITAAWRREWMELAAHDVREVAIGDETDVLIGATPSRNRPDYYVGGTLPWLKTGEIRFGEVADTAEHITEEAHASSSTKLIPAGSCVMAMKGQGATRGRVAMTAAPMTMNEASAAFLESNSVAPRYLFHWFWSTYRDTRELGDGTSQPNLNSAMVRNLRVLLPSKTEQLAIIERLDRFLKVHRAAETTKQAADELRASAYSELLTGARTIERGRP